MSLSPADILKASGLPGANSPIARRLASGGFWSLAGDAGSRALSFAAAVVVARLLGVAEFGAFALIQSTLAMLMTFAMFGMGQTSSRFIATYRTTDPARAEGIAGVALRFAALTGFLAAAGLFAAAPYIAMTILRAPELAGPLRIVAPVLFLYAISSALSGAVAGFESFSRLARLSWIASLANFIAVLAGVSLWGLQGAMVGLAGSELVRCALTMLLAREVMAENRMKLLGRPRRGDARVLWQFTLPLFLGSVLNAPIMWACQTVIARLPDGMTQVGLYNAAQKWMTIVILVPMATSAAFGPVLASLHGNEGSRAHRRTTLKLAVVQFVLTAVPAAFLALLSPWAATIFGPDFVAAAPVVVVMMMLAPVYVLNSLYWQAMTSSGHAWTSLLLAVLWALVATSLMWAWQTGGAVALAKALLVAHAARLAAAIVVMKWLGRQSHGRRISPFSVGNPQSCSPHIESDHAAEH